MSTDTSFPADNFANAKKIADSEFVNNRIEVLEYLGYASNVRMSTSAVLGGIVRKGYIVVHSAPPVVFKGIAARFKMVSISEEAGGVLIPVNEVK